MTKEMGKIWKDNKKDLERKYVGIIHIPLEATRQKILQRQGMEFLALSGKSRDADWVLRVFFVLEGSRGRIETKLYLDTHMNI